MCQKCGCNTCETIRGPLLTEGKVKKLISENLSYHIDNNISLMENVFRIGSDAHLSTSNNHYLISFFNFYLIHISIIKLQVQEKQFS